jgi:hypothetical protein
MSAYPAEPQILLLVILDRDRVNLAMARHQIPKLLRELRRMSQTSRFTRARQLTSTVLPGWRPGLGPNGRRRSRTRRPIAPG